MTLLATHTPSIGAALKHAARILEERSDSPRLDAEILLSHVLEVPRSALLVRGDDAADLDSLAAFETLIERRAAGEPVAYLTGVREFWSLSLRVGPAVLVPRPETELLVELAMALVPVTGKYRVLDLGTGSGAIALAIAAERPQADITAIDISAAALAMARHNAERLRLGVRWQRGHWFDAVPGERFDLILANPPYIAADDPALATLASEPLLALSPGPTGLEALAEIVRCAAEHVRPFGRLLLEHGSSQASAVRRLLAERGWQDIRSHDDLAARPRVTSAQLLFNVNDRTSYDSL
jgi:release factor glutamine methyltransferase